MASLSEGRRKFLLATPITLYQNIDKICAYCKIILLSPQEQTNHIKIHKIYDKEDIHLSNQKLHTYYLNNILDNTDIITIEKGKHTDMQTKYSKIAILKTYKTAMYSLTLLSEHEENKQLSLALNALAKEFDIPKSTFKFDQKNIWLSKCHLHL